MAEKIRAWGWLGLLTRLLLGGLFLFAAYVKLRNPVIFRQGVDAFKILPEHLSILAAYVVPWTELVAGVLLVLGLWARSAALVIGTMLVAFIAAMVSVLYRGIDAHCSCFGKFEIPCEGPVGWCHLVRNGVLVGLAVIVVAIGPGTLAMDRESTK
ncbi:thiosulfate dehydrogenase [quinone] large subunit [Phycisphaerales bacterium]|nr:thiosulfate dehydrogenase [quinone] large subunit [Phycisphaerales bacterium]